MDALVGTDFAGYRIERELGRSGTGNVYLAYDSRLGRKVALKLLPSELADDAAFRQRFVRSSLLTAALEHPNVVPVYDVGETEDRLYMVMRYIAGRALSARLRDGRLEPSEAVAIAEQVARALDAAHEQRFVHRDVKPQNILVDPSGTAYLVDFFVATVSPAEAAAHFGTPAYMAPEQCRRDELDGRADVYALGCVLYECLTGDPPFGNRVEDTLLAQALDPVPKVSGTRPDLPRELDAVFEKALAKDPGARYPSASALVDAVTQALGPKGRPSPSGTVTFLFTDIEGSTQLLRKLRQHYPQLVAEHHQLLHSALARHGGSEVDSRGEELFAVFATATDAVLAALHAQQELARHAWPEGVAVRIRIGIHTGRASVAGERYFGLAVHRAARISAVATGGQTVISETTRALLGDEEEELGGVTFRDLGPHDLKDFPRPVRLFEVVSA